MKSMQKRYGAKKGKSVFYATANKMGMKPASMPPAPMGMPSPAMMPSHGSLTMPVDIGAARQEEGVKVGGFSDGPTVTCKM